MKWPGLEDRTPALTTYKYRTVASSRKGQTICIIYLLQLHIAGAPFQAHVTEIWGNLPSLSPRGRLEAPSWRQRADNVWLWLALPQLACKKKAQHPAQRAGMSLRMKWAISLALTSRAVVQLFYRQNEARYKTRTLQCSPWWDWLYLKHIKKFKSKGLLKTIKIIVLNNWAWQLNDNNK